MEQYSKTDIALKNLIENMRKNDMVFPTTEELVKEVSELLDCLGVPDSSVQIEAEDENSITIPQERYDELLRSESEIDILCTLVRDHRLGSVTLLAALDSIASMRERRLDSGEVEADDK